jgi:hypothetical protein
VSIFSPRAFSLRRVISSLQGHGLTEEDAALSSRVPEISSY